MKRHRLLIASTLCWFLALAALLSAAGSPLAYVYVLACALPFLLAPAARRVPLWLAGGTASAIFVAAGVLGAWPLDAFTLPVVGAIFVSLLLAKALGSCEDAFERAVQFAMNEGLTEPGSIGNRQSSLYVELRRARTHHRDVSMLAISPANIDDVDADALVAEVVRKNVAAHVRASLASLLSDEMRAFDLLAVRDGHFVSLLPETDSAKAMEAAERLRAAAREKLGLELDIGVSHFPTQEVTLDGLLSRAESEMKAVAEASNVAENPTGQLEHSWRP